MVLRVLFVLEVPQPRGALWPSPCVYLPLSIPCERAGPAAAPAALGKGTTANEQEGDGDQRALLTKWVKWKEIGHCGSRVCPC